MTRNKKKAIRMVSMFMLVAIIFSVMVIPIGEVGGLAITADAADLENKTANFSTNFNLTGNPANDIVLIAEAQKNRSKSSMGYRYAWCASFVSDCARIAGLSKVIPADAWVPTFFKGIKDAGGERVYSPMRGDIVFYWCSACNSYVHVGIMQSSTKSIEGNYSGKVTSGVSSYRHESDSGYIHSTSDYVSRVYLRPNYCSNAPTSISLKKGNVTNTVTVSWKAPIVGKGKTLSYYDVEIYRSDSTKLYKKIFNVRKTSTSLTLTLPAGNTYTAQVAAVYTDSSYYFTERSNSVTLSKETPKQTIKNLPSGTISGFTLSNYTQTAVYSDSALKNRLYGREIWSTDCCRILQIVSDKVLKIQYPAGKTWKTVYVSANMFFNGNSVKKIAIKHNTSVYRKSTGYSTIGTSWTTDTIFAIGDPLNNRQQIVYNISGGGWKMGFIPTSTIK